LAPPLAGPAGRPFAEGPGFVITLPLCGQKEPCSKRAGGTMAAPVCLSPRKLASERASQLAS